MQDSTVQFNGKKYCLHKMEQGETLYQLSRKYKVAFSSIRQGNPDKGDEVGLGEIVRIPCTYIAPIKETVVEEIQLEEIQLIEIQTGVPGQVEDTTIQLPSGYFWHEVQQGETVYSLLKKHNTTKYQFFKDNKLVAKEGLKTGQRVFFFKKEPVVIDSLFNPIKSFSTNIDSLSLADTTVFRIGFLLPFNLEQNKSRIKKVKSGKEVEILNQTKFFLEFLQGAKFALDSLKNKGLNIQVFVFDTKSDTSHIATLINKEEFKKLDMIIGPAFGHNFEYLAKKINGRATYLVSPYGKKMSILSGNPKVIKLRSSLGSRVKVLADFLYNNYKNDNIILSHEGAGDLLLIEKLQMEILALSLLNDSVMMASPSVVKGVFEPVVKLDAQQKNIVVSMNTKESFSTKLVVKMQNNHKDFEIVLIGMEEWKSYKNIEVRYWESLSMHLVGNLDFRYLGVKNGHFFKSYYKVHYTEPSYHAVLANELLLNILGDIKGSKYSHSQITGKLISGEISNYQFKYTGSQTGVDNKSVSVFKYEDFKFVSVHN